jgi:simple sugar transport system permease protein
MFGALGEILTEKAGHLNLGVPGLMLIGGFASWATAFAYEMQTEEPNIILLILLPILAAFGAAAIAGLVYAFFVTTLRANQNVTGLALTSLGAGIAGFGGNYILVSLKRDFGNAAVTADAYSDGLHNLFEFEEGSIMESISKILFSHGFVIYVAIAVAILMFLFFKKTRTGLNLRSVGENPATADAAGINVTAYKYIATVIGAGICGLGGMFYVMSNNGGWSTNNNIQAFGWLAVALVIFSTWRPVNSIWGSYLFAFLFWAFTYLPNVLGLSLPKEQRTLLADLLQMLPYLVTIIVLVFTSMRKNRDNQAPASLGLSYFREDR